MDLTKELVMLYRKSEGSPERALQSLSRMRGLKPHMLYGRILGILISKNASEYIGEHLKGYRRANGVDGRAFLYFLCELEALIFKCPPKRIAHLCFQKPLVVQDERLHVFVNKPNPNAA